MSAGVHARARGGYIIQISDIPGYVNDVMHRKRRLRILRFEKSQGWVLASEEDGWLSELAEALWRVPHVVVVVVGGGQMKKSS